MVATNRPRYFILDKIRVLSFLRIKTICNKSGSRVASNWRLTQYSTPFNTVKYQRFVATIFPCTQQP